MSNINKILFIHVGTHKTGTTTLQFLMKKYENLILKNGIYIPKSGIVFSSSNAQHNLAWELYGDKRFDPKYGTVSDMIKEITSIPQDKVLISSEDFEHLYWKPEKLTRLKRLVENAGYTVYIIIFFRDVISYVSSMYVAFIQLGYCISEEEYINEILFPDKFKWLCFEYQKISKGFTDVFGENQVIVNKYSSPIQDKFFKIINVTGIPKENVILNSAISAGKVRILLSYNKILKKYNLSSDNIIMSHIRGLILKGNNVNYKKYVLPFYFQEKLKIKFKSTIEYFTTIK